MQPARASRPARLLRIASLHPSLPQRCRPYSQKKTQKKPAEPRSPSPKPFPGPGPGPTASSTEPPPKTWRKMGAKPTAAPLTGSGSGGAGADAPSLYESLLRQRRRTPTYESARPYLARIGKCLAFGCDAKQTAVAGRLIKRVVENWERLQMGQTNNATVPEAVFRTRINGEEKAKLTKEANKGWVEIPRMFPPIEVAEQAAHVFFDHIMESATNPRSHRSWVRIQAAQRRALRLETHDIKSTPPLGLRDARFPVHMSVYRVRRPQNIRVYTRLEWVEEFDDRVRLTLKTAMWSTRYMDFIAEAQLTYIFKPYQVSIHWFMREMDRVAEFGTRGAVKELERLKAAIRKLETDTWDREDAVEDFGSAAAGARAAQPVVDFRGAAEPAGAGVKSKV